MSGPAGAAVPSHDSDDPDKDEKEPPMPEMIRLTVDTERCIGSGQCEMLEAEVFEIDDDTAVATIIGDPVLPADRARTLIDRCPGSAIIAAADRA